MPERFDYPEQGWSSELNARERKRRDNQIAKHKEELTDLTGQWSNGEITQEQFNKQIGLRGWTWLPGSPVNAVQGMVPNILRSGWNIGQDLAKSAATMKEVYRGVIKLLDPRRQIHEIKVGEPEDDEQQR